MRNLQVSRLPRGISVLAMLQVALVAMLASACMVDDVTFQGPPPVTPELCAVEGDEDGNGQADCEDLACANVARCMAVCRNGQQERGEECDTGGNTATCDFDCTAPACNDGIFNRAAEEADPPSSPSTVVPMDSATCRYDFSSIEQLYCAGTCSWGGASGCQQEDADIFCKLKTGKPESVASSYTTGQTLDAPGLCCPSAPSGCVLLGGVNRGVTMPVAVHETNLRSTHGAGQAIISVTCIP